MQVQHLLLSSSTSALTSVCTLSANTDLAAMCSHGTGIAITLYHILCQQHALAKLRKDCILTVSCQVTIFGSLACGQASEAHYVPMQRQPHGICVAEVLLCVCGDASMCGNVNLPPAIFPPKPGFLLL